MLGRISLFPFLNFVDIPNMSDAAEKLSPKSSDKGAVDLNLYEHHDEEKGSKNIKMAAMGYEQELKRNLSMWTALGLGASIIAAPFGLSTSASFSLINGECKRENDSFLNTLGWYLTFLFRWTNFIHLGMVPFESYLTLYCCQSG